MKEKRHSPSLFGPLLLIAIGVIWLLSNMGLLGGLSWSALFRLWPLLLVFGGLNMLARQVRNPLGGLLSAIVGIIAVVVLVVALLGGDEITLFSGASPELKRNEGVVVERGDVEQAELRIDFDRVPAGINPLDMTDNILAGSLTYYGDLIIDVDRRGSSAYVNLDTKYEGFFISMFDPWGNLREGDQWNLGVTTAIPLELDLDFASGRADANLVGVQLTDLVVDGGSGVYTLILPDGAYDAEIDGGSGSGTVTLPMTASGEYKLDGGSGAISIEVPSSLALQIEFESGSGGISADNQLTLIEEDGRDSVWQSENYDTASQQVELEIDGGSGHITVEVLPTTGR